MSGQLIELGLNDFNLSAGRTDKGATLLWLVEQLFDLIAELPVSSEAFKTEEFRERQKEYLNRLSQSTTVGATVIARDYLNLCQDYFQRASVYLLDRESEFNQAIQVLRHAVAELVGETSDFQNRLNESSERFERLTGVQNLRELKESLAREVSHLKQTLADKQEQEDKSQRRMIEQIQDLRSQLVEAKVEASLDSLTSLANRRSLDDEIKQRIARLKMEERPFAFTLIDLDNFKAINDTYGHPVGDFVLQYLGQFLRNSVRANDFVARYGGEEFCILFDNITLQQAEQRLGALLQNLAASVIEFDQGGQHLSLMVTASCGLAECNAREQSWELIMRTDGALYEAKKRGKNRLVTSG